MLKITFFIVFFFMHKCLVIYCDSLFAILITITTIILRSNLKQKKTSLPKLTLHLAIRVRKQMKINIRMENQNVYVEKVRELQCSFSIIS